MSNLMEAGVHFAIRDFPEATPLLIHLLAAISEYEAKLIRDRTREALRQKKRTASYLGRIARSIGNFTKIDAWSALLKATNGQRLSAELSRANAFSSSKKVQRASTSWEEIRRNC